MSNIAPIVYADPGVPAGESIPAETAQDAQPFDELLAGSSGAAPAGAMPFNSWPNIPLPADPAPALETRVEEASDEALPTSARGEDGEETRSPEADVTRLSSCLAMWQILPPVALEFEQVVNPGDRAAVISSVEEETGRVAMISPPATDLDGAPMVVAAPTHRHLRPAPEPSRGVFSAPPVADADPAAVTASTTPAKASFSNLAPPAHPSEIKPLRPSPPDAEVPRATLNGIPVAKEQRDMPHPVLDLPTKSAPAAFAESETRLETERAFRIGGPAAVATMPEHLGREETGGETSDWREPRNPDQGFPFALGKEVSHELEFSEPAAKPVAGDTAQVIDHIERAIERMRTQGGQRLEMRLPMRDGEEVVVKLRVEHGEVKATFQSASEGLRQALETGWSLASQTSPERAARAMPAVFESPAMHSGMGGFQQSPNQRERGNSEPSADPAFAPQPPQNERPREAAARPASSPVIPSATVKLYA